MQRKELGGTMGHVLADPALTCAALEAVRRHLVDVRDGAVPEQLAFDAPGATRELQLRNERSSRDAPGAAPSATGAVELQLAPTTGLEPRPRRTTLRIGG